MTAASRPVRNREAAPGTVLRRALLAWGLGDLALGRVGAGVTWLVAEALSLALVAYLALGLADTTAYLVPYLAGTAFLVAWAAQAASAYRRARAAPGAVGPAPVRSPATAVAWLGLPILVWGTGFWLVSGGTATPAAVLDRFEAAWPDLEAQGSLPSSVTASPEVTAAAREALAAIRTHCAAAGDCTDDPQTLLRDLRITVTEQGETSATATAELVTFERRPATFLWFIAGTELVPVPTATVLTLQLEAVPAPLPGGLDLGARRWTLLNAVAAG